MSPLKYWNKQRHILLVKVVVVLYWLKLSKRKQIGQSAALNKLEE